MGHLVTFTEKQDGSGRQIHVRTWAATSDDQAIDFARKQLALLDGKLTSADLHVGAVSALDYPRPDGDHMILGPGVIVGDAAPWSSVISWNGKNYVPQDEVYAGPKFTDRELDALRRVVQGDAFDNTAFDNTAYVDVALGKIIEHIGEDGAKVQ